MADHPDLEWLQGARAAIDAWLAAPPPHPTSQLTGGGAVAAVEQRLSAVHDGRPVLLMPSATYGLRVALDALGVRAGDEVLLPVLDWPASLAAVRSIGATPVPVRVSAETLTIDPASAAALRSARTRAAIACHPIGIPADVPALRAALPGVAIVEDAAQAFGSSIDGMRVGTLGDAAVLSFGPGKPVHAGEAGAVIVRDHDLLDEVLRTAAHPVRQRVGGVADPEPAPFTVRVHPLAAVLLDHALKSFDSEPGVREHREVVARLRAAGVAALGADERRRIATGSVAVRADDLDADVLPGGLVGTRTELFDIPSILRSAPVTRRIALVRRVRRHAGAVTERR